MKASRADVCVVACAELFRGDGEILASPMGSIPALGARLARLTFEPDLLISDGEALLLADDLSTVEGWLPYRKVFDVVAHGSRHVVMGVNQLDRHGNQNISCIGQHARPTRQLLGFRGAPGNTVNHRTSYWVPRHSRRVFVDAVDVVSGVGYHRLDGPAGRFHDVYRVVTNLAVLGFVDGTMRLVSTHPGVTPEEVAEQTGFPLDTTDVGTTRTPTDEELRLLDELDPDGRRHREVME
ncbi:MAG TPA: CoA-transferase [Actinophytocola sp.]|uniref:CoA-transferase subunit beta n=1 Tax=Actinophytocola sp. TaxID=1872138 RepID=UPI002DDCCE0A|nr:CoA-transferase [Actinophytocola sp.]HEV2784438.1 CoA-transferase [Actinophytocola sp.]